MKNNTRKRIAGAVCAAAMLFSAVSNTLFPFTVHEPYAITARSETEDPLCQQSIELHPNGTDAGQVITLEGMMPAGASAEAVDVSEMHQGIAAYDITITDGSSEFQPSADSPILVEIADPAIPDCDTLTLWHIHDDGLYEEVTDFTVEDGVIRFYASGFSVYEIVSGSAVLQPVTSLDVLSGERAKKGFLLYYGENQFFSNLLNKNGCITETSDVQHAAVWYLEETADGYQLYTYAEGQKKYLRNTGKGASDYKIELSDTADLLEISAGSTENGFHLKKKDENKWLQHSNNGKGIRYFKEASDTVNANIKLYYADKAVQYSTDTELDGKTCGLMHFTGGTHGYAMMADEEVHTLVEVVTHPRSASDKGITLYVDLDSEITRWTFHTAGNDTYTLAGETIDGTRYLAVRDGALVLTDSAGDAGAFRTEQEPGGRLRLSYGEQYVTFVSSDDGAENTSDFILADTASPASDLYLLDFAELSDSDLITYSADRISVSKPVTGQKVIVYTRIWNERYKKYDIYAVDHDGTLYPCYASGGKILWLKDGSSALEWEFTEYRDAVTKQPNYYYELYNPYSEQFLAPQLDGDQILSGSTIGINMPGRRSGDFYSAIGAWDDRHYAYVGMKPDETNSRLIPCALSNSASFYFATLEELNLSDALHPVSTLDHTQLGITMKMVDFAGTSGGEGATEQNAYLRNTTFRSDHETKGLLSSELNANGYPTASETGKDLGELYRNAKEVNHLFIDSIYQASGYFEFDSTQNFASLPSAEGGDFTVYRELGTSDGESKSTLEHGQFFPYNQIEAGKYSVSNPLNLYNADARTDNRNAGVLPEEDPRKYEKLYSAGSKGGTGSDKINYYFGMEMEASFVQTVSGLDAWGHDIIFEFKGDDDFWLYVDNELVIDLGGIHSALSGSVNFRTGEVIVNGSSTTLYELFRNNLQARNAGNVEQTLLELFEENGSGQYTFRDYTRHTMRIFYMERGAGASNLRMHFNLASVTPGNVVLSKNIKGDGAALLDTDFVEYPFQIYYTLPEGENGEPGEEHLLRNDDEHVRVTYQLSSQPVTYVKRYRPPGVDDADAYESIYFINPKKHAEISFPNETISYRIVECAVDSTIYEKVLINGQPVPPERIEVRGDLKSYCSDSISAQQRPTITFDNYVSENVIKDLFITKKLYDENGEAVTDDPATFNFRLYLSSLNLDADQIPAANMFPYHVLSPNKILCRYDPAANGFAETGLPYSREAVRALEAYCDSDETNDTLWQTYNASHSEPIGSYGITPESITFQTSGFGAVSRIPAGYTVCVPGLPVNSVFRVTEDPKPGYGLIGYACVLGDITNADDEMSAIPSYLPFDPDCPNAGKVIAKENPQMEVHNKKGFGLTVKKQWSDLGITTYHEPVYTAVYVDGVLLEGSVREIASPASSAYYFWDSPDSTAENGFADYVVKEVTLDGMFTVAEDGTVLGSPSVTPLEQGDSLMLSAVPAGEEQSAEFRYVVSYKPGTAVDSTRTDVITNTRDNGLAIRLFRWDSTEPLAGGSFTLKDSSGNILGQYTSSADGIVTILYPFEPDMLYALTETAAPAGFVGMQKELRFAVDSGQTLSLYESDGTAWGSQDPQDKKWASGKPGQNGITAFVDVYNKPFCFMLVKTDSEKTGYTLDSAHFALYKQVSAAVSGYGKSRTPMTGFEDLVTENGMVEICGGTSGRVLDPGRKGTVFYLTETSAPLTYQTPGEDIRFRLSPLGVLSMDGNSQGELTETEDSYVFTLHVPNVRDAELTQLSIRKLVEGAFGNKEKDFTFTMTIGDAGTEDTFAWTKNGILQTPIRSGESFTMRHSDKLVFALPVGSEITVTEEQEGYQTTFRLNDTETENGPGMTFLLSEPTELLVTNTLHGVIATGVDTTAGHGMLLLLLPLLPVIVLLHIRRKQDHTE